MNPGKALRHPWKLVWSIRRARSSTKPGNSSRGKTPVVLTLAGSKIPKTSMSPVVLPTTDAMGSRSGQYNRQDALTHYLTMMATQSQTRNCHLPRFVWLRRHWRAEPSIFKEAVEVYPGPPPFYIQAGRRGGPGYHVQGGRGASFLCLASGRQCSLPPSPLRECQVYAELLFRGAVQHVLYIRRIKNVSGYQSGVDRLFRPARYRKLAPLPPWTNWTSYRAGFAKLAPLPPPIQD